MTEIGMLRQVGEPCFYGSTRPITRGGAHASPKNLGPFTRAHTIWRFGVAVTWWSWSTQLLYIEPG